MAINDEYCWTGTHPGGWECATCTAKAEQEAYVTLLKEQEAFMRLHWNADSFTYDNENYLLTATYHSPIHKEAIRKKQHEQ